MEAEPLLQVDTLEITLKALTITAISELVEGDEDIPNLVVAMTSACNFRAESVWVQFERLDVEKLKEAGQVKLTLSLKLNPTFLCLGGQFSKMNELAWLVNFPPITLADGYAMSVVDWLSESEITVAGTIDTEVIHQSLTRVLGFTRE